MLDIRTVLLPFNFSQPCRAAAATGFEVARRFEAAVEIVHAVPHTYVEYSPFDAGKYRDELIPPEQDLYKWLDSEASKLIPEDWNGAWRRSVMTGDPAACIVERAGQVPGPLVVMPTHGFGKVRRFILGSVTSKILHDVDAPVLTGAHSEQEPVFGRVPYKKVACAVDLRESCSDTLAWAWQFAQRWEASLTVIHVVSWLERAPVETDGLTEELRDALARSARRECRDLIQNVGCEASLKVDVGAAVEIVPQLLEEAEADLLIIGRGRDKGPVGRLWSHAYGLIRRSPVPVLSV